MARVSFLLISVFLLSLAVFSLFLTTKKTSLASSCGEDNISEFYDPTIASGVFEGKQIKVPQLALENVETQVLGTTDSSDKWIEIDLKAQKLRAWEGNQLFLESLVSTGLARTPTPTGEFNVWFKTQSTRMRGGVGAYAYDLPNVPYVMFFQNDKVPGSKGYGLHGTYWHSDFGNVRSHGCVNLPTNVAKELFYWSSPVVDTGKRSIKSSDDNPGIKIIIHN